MTTNSIHDYLGLSCQRMCLSVVVLDASKKQNTLCEKHASGVCTCSVHSALPLVKQ